MALFEAVQAVLPLTQTLFVQVGVEDKCEQSAEIEQTLQTPLEHFEEPTTVQLAFVLQATQPFVRSQ